MDYWLCNTLRAKTTFEIASAASPIRAASNLFIALSRIVLSTCKDPSNLVIIEAWPAEVDDTFFCLSSVVDIGGKDDYRVSKIVLTYSFHLQWEQGQYC